jgi:Carboxypeptidase regulatory-like domain
MLYRTLIISFFVAAAFAFSSTALAQTSTIQGQVRGIDGHPMQGAQIRLERKDQTSALISTTTDAKGHYTTNKLPVGLYRITVVGVDGAVKSSTNIKTAGNSARVDFNLKPTAKKTQQYVWVAPETGTHMGGRWVQVDENGTPIAGGMNIETASGELEREMYRRQTNGTIKH